MLYHVPRTCWEKIDQESKDISAFREFDAYVLLGDPGSGKTELFKKEALNIDGLYLSARDFLTFNRRDDWQGRTLFIDGLDETRAGKADGRTPLDAIRGKLDQLGNPRFRLSCREADWLGSNDQGALEACSPNGKVNVLHLNSLSKKDVLLILTNDSRTDNADDFLDKADVFGLDALLYNPQTLDMLIAAVQGNDWPSTKLETYELASRKLAQESNSEHKSVSTRGLPNIDQLLDAAGVLYAIQLLANATEFNLDDDECDSKVCINTLEIVEILPCREVLKTRLFKSISERRLQSAHRSVAEYLGARFLDKRIREGLPLKRVLALMTGVDGGVVAALRGLMAWLCAHSIEARDHLIKIDPLGVVLYGDAQLFSKDTKIRLLFALKDEVKRSGYLRYDHRANHPFASLTTRDITDHLLNLLNDNTREKTEQIILGCIMDGLYSSASIPELKNSLIKIIRDDTYWEGVRVGAVEAYIRQYPNDIDTLLYIARDLKDNTIKDQNNRLIGLLLPKLFPKDIKANEVFDYLKRPIDPRNVSVDWFWNHTFINLVEEQDIPVLLDNLASKDAEFLRLTSVSDLFDIAGNLLLRGLKAYGSTITCDRLYGWLSIGLDNYSSSRLADKLLNEIRAWLEENPKCYLPTLLIGLSHVNDPEKVRAGIYDAVARLYGALPPETIGLWWLEQALIEKNQKIKDEYFSQAFWTLLSDRGHQGLSLKFFEDWVEKYPQFCKIYKEVSFCPIEDWRYKNVQSQKKWAAQHEEEKAARFKYFNDQLSAIEDGSAYPQVFHHLASAYFDHFSGTKGNTGSERLADFLFQDKNLIHAAKSGLRKIIYRTDLPQTSEIFKLATERREHFIRLPFLTCLSELYNETPSILDALNDDLASKALAFWYTYGAGNELPWVKPLSLSRTTLCAQITIEYVRTMLAAKVQNIYGLYQLAHDPKYEDIAKLTTISLLTSYPVRSIKEQLSNLEHLLKASISYSDRVILLQLVADKLALKSMDVAQRAYWIITGLILDPAKYEPTVRKYFKGNVIRINYLSSFLYDGLGSHTPSYSLQPSSISLIIELLAPRCSPQWPERSDGRVTNAMNEGDYVRGLVNRLAENPDDNCREVINHLQSLPNLTAWQDYLLSALETQKISHREALFEHPSVNQVAQTLNNLKPANVADLAALTIDYISILAKEFCTSNTDSYKRFWNVDGNNKLLNPRPENSCRDYLIERLKPHFSQLGIDVQPETHEANDKRADIRMSFSENGKKYSLPVEIKLDRSADLWRAIHEQLIPLYSRDPDTQGRGLFLVLWFGGESVPAPPSGKRPKSATELRDKLIESLTTQEQTFIDVFVLDVSAQS